MKKSMILLLSVLSLSVFSNASFSQEVSQQLYEYNREKGTAKLYWFDSGSNSYTAYDCSGKITKKDGKTYLKCANTQLLSAKNLRLEYSGFYPEEKCVDEKLSSIMFDGRWLPVSDDILLDYSGDRKEMVCFAGKNTTDEGLYKFSADKGWDRMSVNRNGITIPIHEKVTVKRGCQTVKKGENINVLVGASNGSIKLKFNRIGNN